MVNGPTDSDDGGQNPPPDAPAPEPPSASEPAVEPEIVAPPQLEIGDDNPIFKGGWSGTASTSVEVSDEGDDAGSSE